MPKELIIKWDTGKENKEPDTLRMGAIRLYRIEKID